MARKGNKSMDRSYTPIQNSMAYCRSAPPSSQTTMVAVNADIDTLSRAVYELLQPNFIMLIVSRGV